MSKVNVDLGHNGMLKCFAVAFVLVSEQGALARPGGLFCHSDALLLTMILLGCLLAVFRR